MAGDVFGSDILEKEGSLAQGGAQAKGNAKHGWFIYVYLLEKRVKKDGLFGYQNFGETYGNPNVESLEP